MIKLLASSAEPITLYYCKAGIPTGQTIRIAQGKDVYQTSSVSLSGCDAAMLHDNASGQAKKSGARCTLIITYGIVSFATTHQNASLFTNHYTRIT